MPAKRRRAHSASLQGASQRAVSAGIFGSTEYGHAERQRQSLSALHGRDSELLRGSE